MITGLLWNLMRRYVVMALEGVSALDLGVAWWHGAISLTKVRVRQALVETLLRLGNLHSHFRIRSVHVEEIAIDIPWAKLFLAPFAVCY